MQNTRQASTYVITGATSGIGLAAASILARMGANLIAVGRDKVRCQETADQLLSLNPKGLVCCLQADLSLQTQVRQLAKMIDETLSAWQVTSLSGLLNNAATVPFWQQVTAEGFDHQWAVNHLAAYLLTRCLLPRLHAAPTARIVTVSSNSHRHARLDWDDLQSLTHYSVLRAYSRTKLSNILFTLELNRLVTGTRMRAFAADPGLVNTGIGSKSNSALARWVWNLRRRGGVTPQFSARGLVYLLTEPAIQDDPALYWKDGKPIKPAPQALDEKAARRLWEISAQMTGVDGDISELIRQPGE